MRNTEFDAKEDTKITETKSDNNNSSQDNTKNTSDLNTNENNDTSTTNNNDEDSATTPNADEGDWSKSVNNNISQQQPPKKFSSVGKSESVKAGGSSPRVKLTRKSPYVIGPPTAILKGTPKPVITRKPVLPKVSFINVQLYTEKILT